MSWQGNEAKSVVWTEREKSHQRWERDRTRTLLLVVSRKTHTCTVPGVLRIEIRTCDHRIRLWWTVRHEFYFSCSFHSSSVVVSTMGDEDVILNTLLNVLLHCVSLLPTSVCDELIEKRTKKLRDIFGRRGGDQWLSSVLLFSSLQIHNQRVLHIILKSSAIMMWTHETGMKE